MHLRNILYSALAVLTAGTALVAMDSPIPLAEYIQVLNSGDCKEIVKATKTLCSKKSSATGIHIHWSGEELKVVGELRLIDIETKPRDREYGLVPDTVEFDDTLHRKALHDYIVRKILHPGMFGKANIAHVFAKIDALSNSLEGIFGNDPQQFTQIALKHAIIIGFFPHQIDKQLWLANLYNVPLENDVENDTPYRTSINNLIMYVGKHTGETNLFTGKLPLTTRLHHSRHLIGFTCFAAVACIGCWIAYTKHYATDEKEDSEGLEKDESTAHKAV